MPHVTELCLFAAAFVAAFAFGPGLTDFARKALRKARRRSASSRRRCSKRRRTAAVGGRR